jgi:hypothetical protein
MMKRPDIDQNADPLFEPEANPGSSTAWASLVYSLVPLLGIVFVPFAFAFGIHSVLRAAGPRVSREAIKLFIATFIILCAQLGLWWLLFLIPEMSGRP